MKIISFPSGIGLETLGTPVPRVLVNASKVLVETSLFVKSFFTLRTLTLFPLSTFLFLCTTRHCMSFSKQEQPSFKLARFAPISRLKLNNLFCKFFIHHSLIILECLFSLGNFGRQLFLITVFINSSALFNSIYFSSSNWLNTGSSLLTENIPVIHLCALPETGGLG